VCERWAVLALTVAALFGAVVLWLVEVSLVATLAAPPAPLTLLMVVVGWRGAGKRRGRL
jgi:hypothetical protein